jgi:hypothetical protein
VLLVGELVERLLTQPEGGVQAVDLNTEAIVIEHSKTVNNKKFYSDYRYNHTTIKLVIAGYIGIYKPATGGIAELFSDTPADRRTE